MNTFISFEDALQTVLGSASVLEAEWCPLEQALGRVLAEEIVASEDIPPFASSAMDGYAVRAADVVPGGAGLRIVGHLAAGMVPDLTVTQGTCTRIMTGAPVPPGADAVIPREKAAETGGEVTFSERPEPGKHIRPSAEDVRRGDRVFEQWITISPPVVGMLATLGHSRLQVVRAPRVAVITTGDEIVAPDRTPGPGQIRNSNGPGLRAQVLQSGGTCAAFDHAADDPGAIREAILRNQEADMMLFSGGVSVGDHDYVQQVLEDLGMETLFWKVRQRPGKPLLFGKLPRGGRMGSNRKGDILVLGLPGNPVSSAMCFEIYGKPLIRAFMGQRQRPDEQLWAVLSHPIEKVETLHYFARGVASQVSGGGLEVSTTGPQGSNLYHSVVAANCIIHLPEGTGLVDRGAFVAIERLPWADLHPA